jgi:hypothetical protein
VNESWIHKNITSVLAMIVFTFAAIMDIAALFKVIAADKDLSILVLTSVNNFAMMVLAFYYGNSQFRTKPPEPSKETPQ